MKTKKRTSRQTEKRSLVRTAFDIDTDYGTLVADIGALLEAAKHAAVRAVNAAITTTYWQVGRRIIEFEQAGQAGAQYGIKRFASSRRI